MISIYDIIPFSLQILQDVLKGVNDVDKNLKDIEGDIINTAKLLNAIEIKSNEI